MHQLDGHGLAHAGPRVRVQVEPASGGPSNAGVAIVDTGSARSLVSASAARGLGLQVIGTLNVVALGTAAAHVPEYDAVVSFPGTDLPSRRLRLLGVDLGSELLVLLGRDFLTGAVLVYDGIAGAFTLTVTHSG